MNKSDIKEFLESYKLFFEFLLKPSAIISFSRKNKGYKFLLKIFTFYAINTAVFVAFINYLNTKHFVTKWIPLVIIVQCILYIPMLLAPVSFNNINKKEEFVKIIKVAIIEALIVCSTLLYLGIVIYFLFLITEFYFFYYFYLLYSLCITIYICVFFPLKISKRKKLLSIILTYLCCVGINFFSLLTVSGISSNKKIILFDCIYQESIEKTSEVIKFCEYCNKHQQLILELERDFLDSGKKETLESFNKQIDLILMKKEDVLTFKDTIVFNRNKRELLLLIEIIDLYEKIKREINTYEYIPKMFSDELNKKSSELEEMIQQHDKIKKELEDSYNVFDNKEKLIRIDEKVKELEQFLKDSEKTRKQIEINIESVKEINHLQQIVNSKTDEMDKQVSETMNYWKKRQKFLF